MIYFVFCFERKTYSGYLLRLPGAFSAIERLNDYKEREGTWNIYFFLKKIWTTNPVTWICVVIAQLLFCNHRCH